MSVFVSFLTVHVQEREQKLVLDVKDVKDRSVVTSTVSLLFKCHSRTFSQSWTLLNDFFKAAGETGGDYYSFI